MTKLADINVGRLRTQGTLGNVDDAPNQLARVLSTTIAVLTVVAGIWFLFLVITGAIGIMTSGADKQAYAEAKKKITNGVIGLVLVVAAIFIVEIVSLILGVPDILNISGTVANLTTP